MAGEAGIGKSRLVGAFTDELPRRKSTLALGRCFEYLRTPYAPFSEALEFIDRPTTLLLSSRSEDVRPKSELFAAVFTAISNAANQRNTILILEDVHWADDGTIELLDYLARSIATIRRILIVATFRHDSPHDAKLAAIARAQTTQRIELRGLEESPMRELVRAHLGSSAAPRENSIVGLAAGNPFFAEELCKSTAESAIPQSLRAAIEQRFSALNQDQMRALSCAAIFSDEVELDVLAAVLDKPPGDVARALEPAQRISLLIEHGGRFHFKHALTREIVAGRLFASERLTFHERAAAYFESLIERDDSSHIARMAYHFSAAHSLDKAYKYSLQAGTSAYAVHAYADAAKFFEDAAHCATIASAERAEALRKAGDAHFRAGEPRRAQEAYRKALMLYRSMQRWEDAADIYLHMVRSSYNSGKTEEAIAFARAALSELPSMSDNRRASFRAQVGFGLVNSGKPQEALSELAEVSLPALEGNVADSLIYYAAKSGALAAIGEVDAWREQIFQSAAAAEIGVGGAHLIAHYGGIATDAMFLGEADIAEEFFDRALVLSRKLGLQLYEAVFASHAAFERWLRGDARGANLLLETAQSVKSEIPALWAYSALVSLLLGHTKTIDRSIVDSALATGQTAIFAPFLGWYARHLIREGTVAQGVALIERALAAIDHPYAAWDVLIAAAEFGTQRDAARAQLMSAEFRVSASHVHRAFAALIDAHCERRFGSAAVAAERAAEAEREFTTVKWGEYASLAAQSAEPSRADRDGIVLSERERQIGELLVEGCTNRRIAERLWIGEKTVEKHVGSLLRSLGASTRGQAAALLAKASTEARSQ